MAKDVLQVDFEPDDRRPRPGRRRAHDIVCTVFGVLVLLALVALAAHLLPFLLLVLAVAAVLAALSTWRAARRRRTLMQYGWPASHVEPRTYFAYLAGWFIALLVFVPLLIFGAVVAVAVLALVGVVLIVGLVVGLFRV